MPLDVGRVSHLIEQMHRSEDDAGDPIAAGKVLVTDGARGFTWEDAAGSGALFYNVQDYGAVGDGSTDDTTAISDTFTAADATNGGIIYFPPTANYYKITSLITLTAASKYHLFGGGARYGPARVHQATSNTGAFKFAPSSGTGNRVTAPLMESLVVSGAGGASSGRGIEFANDGHVRDCFIYGFYDGIYIGTASYYSSVMETTVTDCDNSGIRLKDTNNTTIDNCRLTGLFTGGTSPIGAMAYGIYIESASPAGHSFRIVNCSIEYFTADGVYVDGAGALWIAGCWFESSQSSSGNAYVNLGPGGSNVVNGAVIESCHLEGPGVAGFQGIKLGRCNDVTIIGNNDTTGFGALTVLISSTANSSKVALVNNAFLSGTISLPAGSVRIEPGTTTTPSSVASANSVGSGPDVAFADHVHAIGGTAGGDLSGTYPNPAVVDDSHNHTAATVSGVGGIGEIIIADTHSTPLVFADLVQNEDQDDLVYADP